MSPLFVRVKNSKTGTVHTVIVPPGVEIPSEFNQFMVDGVFTLTDDETKKKWDAYRRPLEATALETKEITQLLVVALCHIVNYRTFCDEAVFPKDTPAALVMAQLSVAGDATATSTLERQAPLRLLQNDKSEESQNKLATELCGILQKILDGNHSEELLLTAKEFGRVAQDLGKTRPELKELCDKVYTGDLKKAMDQAKITVANRCHSLEGLTVTGVYSGDLSRLTAVSA